MLHFNFVKEGANIFEDKLMEFDTNRVNVADLLLLIEDRLVETNFLFNLIADLVVFKEKADCAVCRRKKLSNYFLMPQTSIGLDIGTSG